MPSATDIERICQGRHSDPFAILGPHHNADHSISLRCFLPGAKSVAAVDEQACLLGQLTACGEAGFFAGHISALGRTCYRLQVCWQDGSCSLLHDPYRFGLALGEIDIWLLAEGSHLRPFEVLGAHPCQMQYIAGTRFAVWAPNASRVSVIGDFNGWDGRRHPMRLRRECGVWELFIPELQPGSLYKYEVCDCNWHATARADPYALQAELRPATASVVGRLPLMKAPSPARKSANALDAPISIYEVHLGSWRRVPEEGNRWLNWDELAERLIPYALDMGFTHLELLPISEHPFDGSWGYQPIGLYAPTARFGPADGFERLVARCHQAGLGLILDWVPAHFPTDGHGLARFDGTCLYEYEDPREGFHNDWNTLIYNLGRTEVRNFLLGNALYWLERFDVDGLRVDAVASMLYRDYSRSEGQWLPNIWGGRENLEAIAFLQRMNEVVGVQRDQAITLAEESTAYPSVSRPTYTGGLGFHYKWNMGWMHDSLNYLAHDPIYRQHHHDQLTFSMVYAFNENFVLPISHDEVVHGKGSLLHKMPGDRWQQFANLRAFLGYMFGHPGKKLLFMGCEFAQEREWNHDQSLDWHLLQQSEHAGVQQLVRDLNHLYCATPALYQQDFVPAGFQWLDGNDREHSVLSFIRWSSQQASFVVVLCNFTPNVWHDYRLGVPQAGHYQQLLNTDWACYGGANVWAAGQAAQTQDIDWHGQAQSLLLTVPPLASVFLTLAAA